MSRTAPALLVLSVAAVDPPSPPLDGDAPLIRRGPPLDPVDPLLLLTRGNPPPCPHCGGERVQRWGRFGRRRRYRCVRCARTFSDFTGTSLHRLRRPELWPSFCRAMLDGQTVRRAAARIGVHRDTAFRWRHRLLRELRSADGRTPLGPLVNVGEHRFYERTWVLFGLDERGRAMGEPIGPVRARPETVRSLLAHRLDRKATVLSVEGPYGAIAGFARQGGVSWLRRHPVDARYDHRVERIPAFAVRFRTWLRRFRGVADHYLGNYAAWFRLVDGRFWRAVV